MSFTLLSLSKAVWGGAGCPVEARARSMPWTLFAVRDEKSGLIVVRDADVKPYETRTVGLLRGDSALRRRLERELRCRQRVYFRYDRRGDLTVL